MTNKDERDNNTGTELVTNCDRFEPLKHSTTQPFAFTEQGVAMLATVFHSDTAVQMSIRIMDAFVAMRHFLVSNAQVFKYLDEGSVKPKQGVFYDGQVFDAYVFVRDLIKKAKKEITLIDNYVDETVLTMLDKRKNRVSAIIYTQQISHQLQLDINRHNAQYPPIKANIFKRSHDRFLIIDDEVYHIGVSIKDLGKKWFGFTLMRDITRAEIINRINGVI